GCRTDHGRLFQAPRVQYVHGQLLLFSSQHLTWRGEKQEGQLPVCEPIDALARVLAQNQISFSQQPAKKSRPKLRMIVKQPAAFSPAGGEWVHGADPALPFRIQEIPIRTQFRWID